MSAAFRSIDGHQLVGMVSHADAAKLPDDNVADPGQAISEAPANNGRRTGPLGVGTDQP